MCRSANGAVSTDALFFRDLMKNGSKVGLAHFEQDYLCASTAATSRDLDTGTRWFRALDAAVCENLLFLLTFQSSTFRRRFLVMKPVSLLLQYDRAGHDYEHIMSIELVPFLWV